jgi:hypothetical protein
MVSCHRECSRISRVGRGGGGAPPSRSEQQEERPTIRCNVVESEKKDLIVRGASIKINPQKRAVLQVERRKRSPVNFLSERRQVDPWSIVNRKTDRHVTLHPLDQTIRFLAKAGAE